jgi:hypothetical protein
MTVFALLAVGAAALAPMWNSGSNGWWPAGFGYPPVTVHAPAYPCSVTSYGPTFHSRHGGWTQDYGAGTACTSGVGMKTLTISEQVLGTDGHTWFTLSGSTFTTGPVAGTTLRLRHQRPALIGHVYRTVATARLVVPNGHAGCSLTGTCYQPLTLTAVSRRLAP